MALKCYQYYFIFYSRRIYLKKKNFTYGTLRNKRRKSRISDHFQTFFRPEEEKIKE